LTGADQEADAAAGTAACHKNVMELSSPRN
jgi:hypothetical protein